MYHNAPLFKDALKVLKLSDTSWCTESHQKPSELHCAVQLQVLLFHLLCEGTTLLKHTPVARFTERLITYLSPKTYLTTHLRPKTCLILKICIKTCHKSILTVN